MSVQTDAEDAIEFIATNAISGMTSHVGPSGLSDQEGVERRVSVRVAGSSMRRLDFGQNEVTDTVEVVFFWHADLGRQIVADELELFTDAILADNTLNTGGAVAGIEDAYVVTSAYVEAADAHMIGAVVEIEVRRIE